MELNLIKFRCFFKVQSSILKITYKIHNRTIPTLILIRDKGFPFLDQTWVFATNLNFLIPISLHLDGVNRCYFKLRLFDLAEFIVWNVKDLRHRVAKIKGGKVTVCGKNSIPLSYKYIYEPPIQQVKIWTTDSKLKIQERI